MIVAAAVCPHPPLLFRELTGQRDIAADLRTSCLAVIGSATAGPVDRVVVVGGADTGRGWDAALEPEIRRFTMSGPEAPGLPLSLGVGKRLLAEAGWRGAVDLVSVAWDASATEVETLAGVVDALPGRAALLVLGDGSARRGDKAPGYLDERAFGYDAATARALADGDPAGLLAQDAGLAAELMVGGRAAFAVLGGVAGTRPARPQTELVYQDDPYGVMYFAACWRL